MSRDQGRVVHQDLRLILSDIWRSVSGRCVDQLREEWAVSSPVRRSGGEQEGGREIILEHQQQQLIQGSDGHWLGMSSSARKVIIRGLSIIRTQ